MAKIVLSGLEAGAALQIGLALGSAQHQFSDLPTSAPAHSVLDADVVFANSSGKAYLPLLQTVRGARPELPFIVVSRLPDTGEWLDALEAGATDYCAAPFERQQLTWLLEIVLKKPSAAAAAA